VPKVFSRLWRALVLLTAGAFFVLPLYAMVRFAFQNVLVVDLTWAKIFSNWSFEKFTTAFQTSSFWDSFWYSIRLALLTSALMCTLVVPTVIWVQLRMPRLRSLVEFLTLLPYVIPAIGLVAGIVVIKPHVRWFIASDYALVPFYLVLSLPFAFRALDNALRSIDLVTLVTASRSLGASWTQTLIRVIVPNIRTAVLSAVFLTIAVVLGEYTIADVLLKRTLPAFTVEYRGSDPRGGYALAVATLLFTTVSFMVLSLITRSKQEKSKWKVKHGKD